MGDDGGMAGDRRRSIATAGDMVRSIAVVLAVVAVILLLNARDERGTTVREVGYAGPLASARSAAAYEVVGPVGLGDGWRPTSVRVPREDGGIVWHVGFVTPEGEYAGLEQAASTTRRFVERFAAGAEVTGDVRIGPATWQRLEGGDPEPRALVLRGDDSTTVVAGTASFEELEELAGSLEAG
jgi:hypothetical protein